MKNALFILVTLILGFSLPYFQQYQFLIRYFLMILLFFSFLKLRIHRQLLSWQHLFIALLSIGLGVVGYFLAAPFGTEHAQAALLMALAPTGVVSIIFADLFRINIGFITASVLISNVATVLIYPTAFYLLLGTAVEVDPITLLLSVFTTVVIPLLLAQVVVLGKPKWAALLSKFGMISFILFLVNIFLAAAKAAHFIRYESDASWSALLGMLLTAGLVCAVSFYIGGFSTRKTVRMEGSLSLGRKNTMLTIWLASTYLQPIVVIAPVAYVLLQNVYNAWQLAQQERQQAMS